MKIVRIEGMSCQHCVKAVKDALGELGETSVLEVELENKLAKVEFVNSVEDQKIKDSIEDAGYDVLSIE